MSAFPTLERAAVSAGHAAGAAKRPPSSECLTFRLGGVEYGIDLHSVRDILDPETPAQVDNMPASVTGVLHLHGLTVPIIDLRAALGLPRAAANAATATVVLNLRDGLVGAVVDSVNEVVRLAPRQIGPATHAHGPMAAHCITGVARLREGRRERTLVLVDIEELLSCVGMGTVAQAFE